MIGQLYNAQGIVITSWTVAETDDSGTFAQRHIFIVADDQLIMRVVEEPIRSNVMMPSALLKLDVQKVILAGEHKWKLARAIDIPTSAMPPPYSSSHTTDTATWVENADMAVSVRDVAVGHFSHLFKHITIVSSLTPTCILHVTLAMAEGGTTTQPADALEKPECHGLIPYLPIELTMQGPWSVYQRQDIEPLPPIPRLPGHVCDDRGPRPKRRTGRAKTASDTAPNAQATIPDIGTTPAAGTTRRHRFGAHPLSPNSIKNWLGRWRVTLEMVSKAWAPAEDPGPDEPSQPVLYYNKKTGQYRYYL